MIQSLQSITAIEAQARAEAFLSDHLPDRFCATSPVLSLDGKAWHVPVVLSYPSTGPLGVVGEILVASDRDDILDHSAVSTMKEAANRLFFENRERIEGT